MNCEFEFEFYCNKFWMKVFFFFFGEAAEPSRLLKTLKNYLEN